MNRTKVLQEIRQMRFVEAYVGWQARRLTQGESRRGREPRYVIATELAKLCRLLKDGQRCQAAILPIAK